MADYSSMKWDVKSTPTNELFSTYPDIEIMYLEVNAMMQGTGIKTIHTPLSPQEIMAFIIYAYHLRSPLVTAFPSIHKRRLEALRCVGYTPVSVQGQQPDKNLMDIIVGANDYVNRLALHFCKFENNYAWITLCREQDILDDVLLTLKQESDGTEKKSAQEILKIKLDIRQKAQDVESKIERLSQELFRDDHNLLNFAASHILLEKRRMITPEDMAIISKDRKEKQAKEAKDILRNGKIKN